MPPFFCLYGSHHLVRSILICSLLISCLIKAETYKAETYKAETYKAEVDRARLIFKGNASVMLKKYAIAEEYYRQAIKADDNEGFYSFGVLELNGYGIDNTIKKAVELYTTAANLNYAQAQYELSVIYSSDNFHLKDNENTFMGSQSLQRIVTNRHAIIWVA